MCAAILWFFQAVYSILVAYMAIPLPMTTCLPMTLCAASTFKNGLVTCVIVTVANGIHLSYYLKQNTYGFGNFQTSFISKN